MVATGALRLVGLGTVPGNPFYDAAVHSMAVSWHAFLFGGLDPSGGVSVDKPPVDLWLQVASVKLLGYNPTALKLPQALAGAASVVVLYDLVRRGFGRGAGLAAAAALAVLPVAVVTARSDTMDTVMAFLLLGAAWLIVRAIETRRLAWLLCAGAAVGLAFNVKLFQALLPLPALALLWVVGSRLRPGRALGAGTAAFLVAVVVAFAWITPVALTPASARPYPIGSTNGSIWNLVFVFNGVDRLHGRPLSTPDTLPAGSQLTPALARSQARRTRELRSGSVTRLFGSRYVSAVGAELFPALCVLAAGVVFAIVLLARRRWRANRLALALALSLGVWVLLGTAIFSHMGHFHLRYFETISPAVAAVLGGGLFALAMRGGWLGRALATAVTVATGVYVASHASAIGTSARYELVACLVAAAAALVLGAWKWTAPVAAALLVASVLVVPAVASRTAVQTHAFDAQRSGALPPGWPGLLNRYLARHRDGTRYSFASISPGRAAPLIADDPQPVLMLTSYRSRPLTTLPQLRRIVRAGQVRYFLIGRRCRSRLTRSTAACPATARWAIAHAVDVSGAVGLPHTGMLYRIDSRTRRS